MSASQFFEACRTRNKRRIRDLLASGADINARGTNLCNALSIACKNRHEDVVQMLLDRGADVNACDYRGKTALMHACYRGFDDIAKWLLRKNANTQITNSFGETVLDQACIAGKEDVVRMLLDYGTPICGPALERACEKDRVNIVDILLAGSKPEDKACWTDMFVRSVSLNKKHIYELFLKHRVDVNGYDSDGVTALIQICGGNRHYFYSYDKVKAVSIAESLLDSGADINARERKKKQRTALMYACYTKNKMIVALLLSHGANVNASDWEGKTSVMYLYLSQMPSQGNYDTKEIMELLLKYNADIQTSDVNGKTALIHCIERVEDISTLLDAGADVNCVCKNGKSALHYASEKGMERVVDLLLNSGADANYVSSKVGESALLYTSERWMGRAVESSLKVGESALLYAAKNGMERAVELLLNAGADVNYVSIQDEKSALLYAAKNGMERAVELLLNAGADANYVSSKVGKSALLYAAKNGMERAVELLLNAGADANYVSIHDGKSALLYASEKGMERALELLLNAGADVNLRSKTGQSAVMMATEFNHLLFLKALVAAGANVDLVDNGGLTVLNHALSRFYSHRFSLSSPLSESACLTFLIESGVLMSRGKLKDVHRNTITESMLWHERGLLLLTIKFGVFEWDWVCKDYPWPYGTDKDNGELALAAFNAGLCPGKIKYRNKITSIIAMSFLASDTETIIKYLKHCYYFPEDYRALSAAVGDRGSLGVKKKALLDSFLSEALRLETLSFLVVSKAISLSGPPGLRHQRVDTLPIPDLLKRGLKFSTSVANI